MKSLKKVAIVLFICLIVAALVCGNSSFATFNMMSTIKTQAGETGNTAVTDPISNVAGSVITIARVICAAVAVAMLAILGMKYMMAAPGEKADIKKHAVVYIVGAIVMFACTGILGIIQKFAKVLE